MLFFVQHIEKLRTHFRLGELYFVQIIPNIFFKFFISSLRKYFMGECRENLYSKFLSSITPSGLLSAECSCVG